jgi:hypothetical protein
MAYLSPMALFLAVWSGSLSVRSSIRSRNHYLIEVPSELSFGHPPNLYILADTIRLRATSRARPCRIASLNGLYSHVKVYLIPRILFDLW